MQMNMYIPDTYLQESIMVQNPAPSNIDAEVSGPAAPRNAGEGKERIHILRKGNGSCPWKNWVYIWTPFQNMG